MTGANALLYLAAALFHSGVPLPITVFQPSPPAGVAEGLIGVVLAVAAAMLVRAPSTRFTWGAYVFALAGTLLGLSIILAARIGGPDLWVHFVMLAGLALGFALLARARGRTRST